MVERGLPKPEVAHKVRNVTSRPDWFDSRFPYPSEMIWPVANLTTS